MLDSSFEEIQHVNSKLHLPIGLSQSRLWIREDGLRYGN